MNMPRRMARALEIGVGRQLLGEHRIRNLRLVTSPAGAVRGKLANPETPLNAPTLDLEDEG